MSPNRKLDLNLQTIRFLADVLRDARLATVPLDDLASLRLSFVEVHGREPSHREFGKWVIGSVSAFPYGFSPNVPMVFAYGSKGNPDIAVAQYHIAFRVAGECLLVTHPVIPGYWAVVVWWKDLVSSEIVDGLVETVWDPAPSSNDTPTGPSED